MSAVSPAPAARRSPAVWIIAAGVVLLVALVFNWQFQPFRTVTVIPEPNLVYVRCLTRQLCFGAKDNLPAMCFPLRPAEDPQHAAYLQACAAR